MDLEPVKSSLLGLGRCDLNLQGCVSLYTHLLRFNKRQEFISRGEKWRKQGREE